MSLESPKQTRGKNTHQSIFPIPTFKLTVGLCLRSIWLHGIAASQYVRSSRDEGRGDLEGRKRKWWTKLLWV